jgi:cephalosporin-C deacetylase-like acetyl esterase
MYKINLLFILIFVSLKTLTAQSPPSEKWVKIIVSPERPDWKYAVGENVKFRVNILKGNVPIAGVKISYEIGPEKMSPTISKEEILKDGSVIIDGGTMKKPGFLRCTVKTEYEGKPFKEWTTAAFSPEKIEPTVTLPNDFKEFWNKAIEENSKLPMDSKMILLPERCTEKVNVYHVGIQNWRNGAKVYGILSVPKKEGKYPALLKVPGAGVRPYYGDINIASEGVVVFEIGIHGIPVNLQQQIYDDLIANYNNNYWINNLNDKDRYFYKRVFLGCIKANDFLTSLPQWDGKNLGVTGSSQGGALSLVTAGLDKRVTCAYVIHPAMCDMTGNLYERAGGWPQPFADKNSWKKASHADNLETVKYYDALNFARFITVPVMFSFGYNDDICPPTSMSAAYNIITSPKEQFLAIESAHWVFNEQMEKQKTWLISQLKK